METEDKFYAERSANKLRQKLCKNSRISVEVDTKGKYHVCVDDG